MKTFTLLGVVLSAAADSFIIFAAKLCEAQYTPAKPDITAKQYNSPKAK